MQQAYQRILQHNPDGQTGHWRGNSGRLAMALTPKVTLTRTNNTTCRQYSQKLLIGGKEENYFGIACRNTEGNWEVPMR